MDTRLIPSMIDVINAFSFYLESCSTPSFYYFQSILFKWATLGSAMPSDPMDFLPMLVGALTFRLVFTFYGSIFVFKCFQRFFRGY